MTSASLRRSFLDFFKEKGHRVIESSKIIPDDDPTLLFTNAGMNQFKNIFLGIEKPDFRRAASVQKCMRASGKHNDLEDVGRDGWHHTFFEMLGNWSFGDYYKKEAIEWAWEFVTERLELPVENLWASVYKDDDEAYEVWLDIVGIEPARVMRLGDLENGDEENFWSMGEIGPCGPCSEIYYDQNPLKERNFQEGSITGNIIELWNLVFMEFDRKTDGSLVHLPEKHVDTGLGLERTAAVLQNVRSNYETDLFIPLIERMQEIAGVRCCRENLVSFQVVADHIRGLVFSIADGAIPSNEGRGYVLRRILRRAVRHGKLLGVSKPFLHKLAETVIQIMNDPYHEIYDRKDVIHRVIQSEEELFIRTLDRGIEEFEKTVERLQEEGSREFPGKEAFILHDTYGFPFDLTMIMAEEKGMSVDQGTFKEEMKLQRERAKSSSQFQAEYEQDKLTDWKIFRENERTVFTGYDRHEQNDMRLVRYRETHGSLMIVFDRTPFYGEAGGQIGDTGSIEGNGVRIRVNNVVRSGDLFIHIGELEEGEVRDIPYMGRIDTGRRSRIMANHTATHLLHYALKKVVGSHASQAGSLVAPERLRFDFNHYSPLTLEQIDEIEEMVNRAVLQNLPLKIYNDIPFAEAKSMGASALFGEKYGERVRVVQIDELSSELCGGTHVKRTGAVGLFKIIKEGSISSGVRRIEAVTNIDSFRLVKKHESILRDITSILHTEVEDATDRIRVMQDTVLELKKKLKREKTTEALENFDPEKGFRRAGGYHTALLKLGESTREEMREMADKLKAKAEKGVVLISSLQDGRVSIILSAADTAVRSGINAGKLLQEILSGKGGKGGGRPHMAQGGGIRPEDIDGVYNRLNDLLEGM